MMKLLFIAMILCLSLCSCHKSKKHARSVMESKKSLVNKWYGKDHFERTPESDQEESLNKVDDNESVEIDAGKMYSHSTLPVRQVIQSLEKLVLGCWLSIGSSRGQIVIRGRCGWRGSFALCGN